MVGVKVEVDAEALKAAVAKSVIDGMMGKELEAALARMREYNSSRFENAFQEVVNQQVKEILGQHVREKLSGPLKAMVAEKLTEKLLEEVVAKVIRSCGLRDY